MTPTRGRAAARTPSERTGHDRLGSLGRAVIAAARKLEGNRRPWAPNRPPAGRRGRSSEIAG